MPAEPTRFEKFVLKYREDHSHPINHFLHLGVGWPMVAASILILPFRPLWSLGLFLGGYAFMFAGHFLFEKNKPTILKRPSTPFVIAWAVICDIARRVARLVAPNSSFARAGRPAAWDRPAS
jgi:hypothetical protein